MELLLEKSGNVARTKGTSDATLTCKNELLYSNFPVLFMTCRPREITELLLTGKYTEL